MALSPSRRILAVVSTIALAVLARPARAAGDRPPPHQPPPEAFTACQGKAARDACSAPFHGGAADGTCTAAEDGQLFCRPARPPLPPEAFAACEGKNASDACSVTLGDQPSGGACSAAQDGRLFCQLFHLRRMPPPPPPEQP